MKFTVKDVSQLPYRTKFPGLVFDTPGNTYESDNLPCDDEDVVRWYEAGFINIEGLEPSADPDPTKRVVMTPEKTVAVLNKRSS